MHWMSKKLWKVNLTQKYGGHFFFSASFTASSLVGRFFARATTWSPSWRTSSSTTTRAPTSPGTPWPLVSLTWPLGAMWPRPRSELWASVEGHKLESDPLVLLGFHWKANETCKTRNLEKPFYVKFGPHWIKKSSIATEVSAKLPFNESCSNLSFRKWGKLQNK